MRTKWIGSTLFLLCCCLLASGCVTHIQKSLDRSVMIAQRCADIEEAVPNRKDVESDLLNAISMRLVATCADGNQSCVGSTSITAPPNPMTFAGNLLANLEQHHTILLSINHQFSETNKSTLRSFRNEQESLRNELIQTQNDIPKALNALYGELRNAKIVLDESLSKAHACERRTNCVAALGRKLATIRPTLDKKVGDLHQKIRDFSALARRSQRLAENTASLLEQFGETLTTTATMEQQAIKNTSNQLKRDTANLVASSAFMEQRLEAGARALDSLFSLEVQVAAADLMATRLYEKVADKMVVGIDRLLSQVDRTIDKVDEHAYGAATLGTYLFEDKIQNKFDGVFTTYIADRLPKNSNTAKLAFMAATCKRLVPDDDNVAKNASLFSPFVFAALIRMQVDLEGGKRSLESVRKEWEQGLIYTDHKSVEAEQKSDTTFLGLVAEAYRVESSTDGGGQKAPSILQQVALCANVEQQLAATEQLTHKELKERSWAACGKAVMSATLIGQGLPDAANPALAHQAIEKAKLDPPASRPAGQPGAEDAAAWRQAMEAVLAATAPKQPSHFERLCQRIRSGTPALRCQPSVSGDTVTLDFDSSFAISKAEDRALEMQIAQLADVLGEEQQVYIFTVYGYASASAYPCRRSIARKPSTCDEKKNYALAKSRADWAINVLRKRLQHRFVSGSDTVGLFNPLSFDTPEDRRIRMKVALQN